MKGPAISPRLRVVCGRYLEFSSASHETHAKFMYNGSMAVIQIRDLPDEVHTQLRVKAAEAGLSLSAYLRRELETLARSKSVAEILGRSDHLRTPLKKGNVLNAVHEARR